MVGSAEVALTDGWRFVAQLGAESSADEWAALCRRVEAQGYSGISLSDHFGPQFAPLIALTAAAAVTERCTLGINVLANDFRHPAVLAKELATLDVISGGRVVAGIGAGWMTSDYDASGIAHDRAGVRIDRTLEAITVLRGLWSQGPFTFDGEHYRIRSLDGQPKPVRGSIPLIVGGGAKRMLTEAARVADIVNIALDYRDGVFGEHAGASGTAAATRQKLDWIQAGAADRKTPPQITVRVLIVEVSEDRWASAARLGRPLGLDAAAILESPHALIGTIGEIVDDLRRRRDEYGFSDYVVSQQALTDIAPVVEELA